MDATGEEFEIPLTQTYPCPGCGEHAPIILHVGIHARPLLRCHSCRETYSGVLVPSKDYPRIMGGISFEAQQGG